MLLCHYNGTDHKPGSSYPSTDGCNTCTCSESGFTSCTEKACMRGKWFTIKCNDFHIHTHCLVELWTKMYHSIDSKRMSTIRVHMTFLNSFSLSRRCEVIILLCMVFYSKLRFFVTLLTLKIVLLIQNPDKKLKRR